MTQFASPQARAKFIYGEHYAISLSAHKVYGFSLAPKIKTTAAYFHGPEEVYEPVTIVSHYENTHYPDCPVTVERKNGERIRTTIACVEF